MGFGHAFWIDQADLLEQDLGVNSYLQYFLFVHEQLVRSKLLEEIATLTLVMDY